MERISHRAERLADELRAALSVIVSGMADPRIGFVTVTGVRLSPDLRHARVMVSVLGDEAQQRASLKRLEAARQYLRHELAQEVALRFTPELSFELDLGVEYSQRVDELLRRAGKQSRKKH